jgi:hypothetical protein
VGYKILRDGTLGLNKDMRYSHAKIILITAVMLFPTFGCTIKYYDTNKLHNDFKTEGFLDRDHFQIIIKGIPEKGLKGLVAERESALNSAKAAMNEKITGSLVKYILDYNIIKLKIKPGDIQNPDEVKKNLTSGVQQFVASGYTAYEYYNPDNSAVLVYRVFKEELIEALESIKPGIELPAAEKPEKK